MRFVELRVRGFDIVLEFVNLFRTFMWVQWLEILRAQFRQILFRVSTSKAKRRA